MMDGARSKEPSRGAARQQPPTNKKGDSAISMGSNQPKDSGYGTQTETDVVMGNTSASNVPSSLQPGNSGNRVIETSKGLWSAPAPKR